MKVETIEKSIFTDALESEMICLHGNTILNVGNNLEFSIMFPIC